jgi:hypothetical protein
MSSCDGSRAMELARATHLYASVAVGKLIRRTTTPGSLLLVPFKTSNKALDKNSARVANSGAEDHIDCDLWATAPPLRGQKLRLSHDTQSGIEQSGFPSYGGDTGSVYRGIQLRFPLEMRCGRRWWRQASAIATGSRPRTACGRAPRHLATGEAEASQVCHTQSAELVPTA